MKRTIIILLLLSVCIAAVSAQEPVIWLPVIRKAACPTPEGWVDIMGDWKIVAKEATTNQMLNPSAGTTGNFAAVGGGTMTRSSTYQRYGLYSYRVQTAANNEGGSLTMSALDNAIHYATMRVRGTLPASWDWSVDDTNYHTPTLVEQLDSNWALYGVQFPAAQCNGQTTFYVRQNGAGAGDFYVDGVQMEQKEYWTTYCDGMREGCEWNGAEDASTSTRSASSYAGGRVRDLKDDYGFGVERHIGTGTAQRTVKMDEYAILPGGEINTPPKVHPRPFTLTGPIIGTGANCNLLDTKEDLEGVLITDSYPVLLRYEGSTTHKQIAAVYEGGLDGNIGPENRIHEKVALRFLAADPYWYGVGGCEEAMLLDTNDSATLRYVAGRLRSTGQWDDLGLTANPTTNGKVWDILVASDGNVYFAGDWTGMDGVAGRDYIAMYTPSNDTWSTVGGASDFNGRIFALAEGPDGTIYAGGEFTNCAGVANADYLAQWDGNDWTAVGNPNQGTAAITAVYKLRFDNNGNLLIGGDFTDWANVAAADYFALWDGSSHSAVGIAGDGTGNVWAIVVDNSNNYYIGGEFNNWGGDANADKLAWWDGSDWASVADTAFSAAVYGMEIDNNGVIYLTGAFTNAAGITEADGIVQFNGTAFFSMGGVGISGGGAAGRDWAIGSDGMVYLSGTFTSVGDLDITDRAAKWNGASWAHLDVNLPGAPTMNAIAVGPSDPVINSNYDVWIGYGDVSPAACYFSGSATVTNNGTAGVYPTIIFERSGGTSAKIEQVRNETTGKELLLDYSLLDGERLTIDLRPTQQSIVSSMFGSVPGAILANSDMGTFVLEPGTNQITSFVDVAGTPTITAWIEWRNKYRGL